MSLFDPGDPCSPIQQQADCEGCVADQMQALQNVLVALVQAIQSAIDTQAKTLSRIAKALTKLASAQCQQQTSTLDPVLQQLINSLSIQISEHTVQISMLNQLFSTVQQQLISQQSTLTQIQNVQQTIGGPTAVIVGPGGPAPAQPAPGTPAVPVPGPTGPILGPSITIQVAPTINIPPPPPVTVILPPSQTTVNVSNVLPSITNAISNVTQIGPITATATVVGGAVTVEPGPSLQQITNIENNIRQIINNWKRPDKPPEPTGAPPKPTPPPKATGLHAVDPIAFPVTWAIAPDDDDWRDASSQWVGDALAAVQNAPSFQAIVDLLKRQVTYLGA